MKIRILLATTAMIAAATAGDANAQTTSRKATTMKAPAVTRSTQPRSSVYRKMARNLAPPAPPLVARRSSGRTATRAKASAASGFGMDTTGRKDLSGRANAFYPSARKPEAVRSQQSASKVRAASKPHKNAQIKK